MSQCFVITKERAGLCSLALKRTTDFSQKPSGKDEVVQTRPEWRLCRLLFQYKLYRAAPHCYTSKFAPELPENVLMAKWRPKKAKGTWAL